MGEQQCLARAAHHARQPEQEGPRALCIAGLADIARHRHQLAAAQRLAVGVRGHGIAGQLGGTARQAAGGELAVEGLAEGGGATEPVHRFLGAC